MEEIVMKSTVAGNRVASDSQIGFGVYRDPYGAGIILLPENKFLPEVCQFF